jgi:hypothetical protein
MIIFLELRNHFFGFFGVKILKFFDEDPESGMPDGDSLDPGSGINIPDPQHWGQSHKNVSFQKVHM